MEKFYLTIATRKSRLAIWQAEYIQNLLKQLYPQSYIELLLLTTKGDEIIDKSLDKIGGKGLFIKELEQALYANKAQLAVHSLKDVPMVLPCYEQNFILAAILARDDVRDAFVSNKYKSLEELPYNAVVGTSSLRRGSILKHLYPNLQIKLLRGNINTRLEKLDNGEYDAIILASAGLKRLKLQARISQFIDTDIMLPSPGQAALAIEIYGEKYLSTVNKLNDYNTQLACSAEREVSLLLGGSCQMPLAAYAKFNNNILTLKAWILSIDGKHCLKAEQSMLVNNIEQAKFLGKLTADNLIEQGALNILKLN